MKHFFELNPVESFDWIKADGNMPDGVEGKLVAVKFVNGEYADHMRPGKDWDWSIGEKLITDYDIIEYVVVDNLEEGWVTVNNSKYGEDNFPTEHFGAMLAIKFESGDIFVTRQLDRIDWSENTCDAVVAVKEISSNPAFTQVSGDLLSMFEQGDFDVIVHGCNCFNTMGAGIAAKIAAKFPEAEKADKKTSKGGFDKLGNYTMAEVEHGHIVNLYTQYGFATPGTDEFNYHAFVLGMQKLIQRFPGQTIGLPLIGCGLAGGDAKRIFALLTILGMTAAKERDVKLVLVNYNG